MKRSSHAGVPQSASRTPSTSGATFASSSSTGTRTDIRGNAVIWPDSATGGHTANARSDRPGGGGRPAWGGVGFVAVFLRSGLDAACCVDAMRVVWQPQGALGGFPRVLTCEAGTPAWTKLCGLLAIAPLLPGHRGDPGEAAGDRTPGLDTRSSWLPKPPSTLRRARTC